MICIEVTRFLSIPPNFSRRTLLEPVTINDQPSERRRQGALMGLMEWLLPSLRGWPHTSGLVSRGIRGSPEGANGLLARPMPGNESTGAARAGAADRRRNETRGSWSSTPDALPGTEFAKGALPEADSGEFSDDLWSNRSYGRLRENHVATADQRESLGLIWT